jgi:hypothetical protein
MASRFAEKGTDPIENKYIPSILLREDPMKLSPIDLSYNPTTQILKLSRIRGRKMRNYLRQAQNKISSHGMQMIDL